MLNRTYLTDLELSYIKVSAFSYELEEVLIAAVTDSLRGPRDFINDTLCFTDSDEPCWKIWRLHPK